MSDPFIPESTKPETSEAVERHGESLPWRCYHCGDVFTDDRCARLHFGRDEDSAPACQIKAGAEQGLLSALRDAEYAAADAQAAIANEGTEAARAYYAQATRHAAALRNAEEAGYERGLSDGRALSAPPVGQNVERVREDLARLHEAARGCEFDLTPADGPIAALTLFVHENGDRLIAALAAAPSVAIGHDGFAWCSPVNGKLPHLPDGMVYGWRTKGGRLYMGEGYPVPARRFSLDTEACDAVLTLAYGPSSVASEKARSDVAAALRNTPAEALREAGYLDRAADMLDLSSSVAIGAGEVERLVRASDIPDYAADDISHLEGLAGYLDGYARDKGRAGLPESRKLFDLIAKRLREYDAIRLAALTPASASIPADVEREACAKIADDEDTAARASLRDAPDPVERAYRRGRGEAGQAIALLIRNRPDLAARPSTPQASDAPSIPEHPTPKVLPLSGGGE